MIKKLIMSVTAVFMLTAVLIYLFWQLPHSKSTYREQSEEESFYESTESTVSYDEESFYESIGPLFLPYKELVGTGVYKLVVTRQQRYGGNSVPVTTTTYYGEGYVNIIEAEGHNTATETLIIGGDAYCFDADLTSAYLLPADSITADTVITDGLSFTETGTATVGLAEYTYERYETDDGAVLDYLFAGKELKKLKLYNGEDYELISIELSADISGGRSRLPEGITVIKP